MSISVSGDAPVLTDYKCGEKLGSVVCKRSLQEAYCPLGHTLFYGKCYRKYNTMSTWKDASVECSMNGSRLAIPTSEPVEVNDHKTGFLFRTTQCLASWFSCQEISWIFDICCRDLGNYSWQGLQDFSRCSKIVERNPRKFLDFLARKARITKILARETRKACIKVIQDL